MGQKNAVTKRYYSDKTRFADLINGVYFQGRKIISADELTEGSEGYAEPQRNDSTNHSRDYLERTRDIKMQHQSGASIRILAIENQHYVDYSMPFRNMQYDVLEYQQQLEEIRRRNETEEDFATTGEYLCKMKKTDRLHPVYTLCLYLGTEPWDGPRSLMDMMDFGEDADNMKVSFADYPFRLYCVNEEHDFSMFHTEIRNVFELLPLRTDKKRLLHTLEQNSTYKRLSEDSLELLSVLMDSPSIWKNRKKYLNRTDINQAVENQESEEYNMCQAIKELIEDGRQEGLSEGLSQGLTQGLSQGLSQGRMDTLKQNVESLMNSLSISLEKACELLNCTNDCEMLSHLLQK